MDMVARLLHHRRPGSSINISSNPYISMALASVRTAWQLLLLPPAVSVLLCMGMGMAVLCLICRVAARKLTALARAAHCLVKEEQQRHHHHAIRGLPPVARYRRKQKQQECCVFCLSVMEEGDEIRELKCRHLFHRACLDRWLLLPTRPPLLATCPLCRARLLPPPPPPVSSAVWAPRWEVTMMMGDGGEEVVEEEEEDMMLFMACVHSRSS